MVADLIANLRRRGVTLAVDADGRLKVEPKSKLTADEIALLRENRDAVLALIVGQHAVSTRTAKPADSQPEPALPHLQPEPVAAEPHGYQEPPSSRRGLDISTGLFRLSGWRAGGGEGAQELGWYLASIGE